MNKEFVKYEQSLKLKELGFDEECFGYYTGDKMHLVIRPSMSRINIPDSYVVTAPLYQQAFRWFMETYGLRGFIGFRPNVKQFDYHVYDMSLSGVEYVKQRTMEEYNKDPLIGSYGETEFACLNKLIEIVEKRGVDGKYKNGVPINWD